MAATGICPRQDTCLAFPNAAYQLQITGPGALTLSGLPPSFLPSISGRALATGAAAAIGFEYAAGTPSVSVAIQPDSWSVGLEGVNVRLDRTPFNGLMRIVGDVQAASGSGVSFANAKLVLGSVLQPVQDLLTFLESLGLPDPLKLSFSNSGWTKTKTYKLRAVAKFDFEFVKPEEIELGLGFGNAASSRKALFTASSQWFANFDFRGIVKVPSLPPLVFIFKFDVAFPATTEPELEELKFQAGVIAPASADLLPGIITLEGSIALAFTLVGGVHSPLGLGVGLILDASGKILTGPLVFAEIQFTEEVDGLFIPNPRSVQATFDLEVDVSYGWFLDITFETTAQYTQDL